MTGGPERSSWTSLAWIGDAVAAEPRLPLVGPYMAYLFFMLLVGFLPSEGPFEQIAIAVHLIAASWVAWLLRGHWPPLGRPHVVLAVVAGASAAALWVGVQRVLTPVEIGGFHLGGTLSLQQGFPFVSSKPPEQIRDVAAEFPTAVAFWSYVVLKITRAVTIVALAEELFWRGFVLRAMVNWRRYDTVPLGAFTWAAFLGTSLLSVLQHPANWFVSIVCWMLFNGLFCWKKSLLFLMLTHAATNLALYLYVVASGDWQFW